VRHPSAAARSAPGAHPEEPQGVAEHRGLRGRAVELLDAEAEQHRVLGDHGRVVRTEHILPETAGVVTGDSVLLGFGIEQLDGPAAQAEVLGDALRLIGVRTPR